MSETPKARWNMMKSACPTRQVLDQIAGKWTMLVLLALDEGRTLRFSQLRNQVEGVSQKMLTQTLRALEVDGLLTRTAYNTVPVTVEYSLTELGNSLAGAVSQLRGWAYDHMSEIEGARQDYARRSNGGHPETSS